MSSRDATHYQHDVEVIDAIEAWDLGYHLGNVVKYVARAGKKTNEQAADLRKAEDYLHRYRTGRWPADEPCPSCTRRRWFARWARRRP